MQTVAMYIAKLADSPFSFGATTTAFGYAKLADAEAAATRTSISFRPKMEIWKMTFRQVLSTDDKRVLEAKGCDLLSSELAKRIPGQAA